MAQDMCVTCSHNVLYHPGDLACTMCECKAFDPPILVPINAEHFSANKLALDQIPVEMLQALAAVYQFGEMKYARDNWKRGTDWHEFYGSALRHIVSFWSGQSIDPESNLPHLAHAIWNLTTLMYYENHGVGTDDRQ